MGICMHFLHFQPLRKIIPYPPIFILRLQKKKKNKNKNFLNNLNYETLHFVIFFLSSFAFLILRSRYSLHHLLWAIHNLCYSLNAWKYFRFMSWLNCWISERISHLKHLKHIYDFEYEIHERISEFRFPSEPRVHD